MPAHHLKGVPISKDFFLEVGPEMLENTVFQFQLAPITVKFDAIPDKKYGKL